MYKSININTVVEHLKNIVDSVRCAVCDKTDGIRMRYSCGHTSCKDCVILAVDCSVCLTPLQNALREPVVDEPLTQRTADAVKLLNEFQNEFNIDVYKRHWLSEQLKVEKDLFPECIQAPAKYFNKRKSSNNTKVDKENILSQLPGEEVTPLVNLKMEKKTENVEMWLNKYVRKPFAELNSNDSTLRQPIRKLQNNNKNTPKKSLKRKISNYAPLSLLKNQSQITDHLTPVKKTKVNKKKSKTENINLKSDTSQYIHSHVTDNDESGIVLDDEAVIVLDDSQSVLIDKDNLALLAVKEAEKNKQNDSTFELYPRSIEQGSNSAQGETIESVPNTKVPFFLKGYFSNKCMDCNKEKLDVSQNVIELDNNNPNNTESAKDFSITVENRSFITMIKIQQIDQTIINKTKCMQSVEVQTDSTEINIVNNNTHEFERSSNQGLSLDQQLRNANKKTNLKSFNKTENVIIEETDSDEDIEPSVSLEVTAEIHRSCEEIDYDILANIDDLEEHRKRMRRGPRGITPTSSNSSEKENYNPNRMRKTPPSKKKPMKK